jgi:hypothetical protein
VPLAANERPSGLKGLARCSVGFNASSRLSLIDRNWRRWRRRRKPRCAAITWTSLRIGATLKVRKSWRAEQAGVAVTLPKSQTSGAKSAGRFGKPDFVYLAKDDVYRCPAGETLEHHFTADEDGQKMRIYLTKACRTCPLKDQCTTSNERRVLAYNLTRVMNIVGIKPLLAAIRA